MKIGILFLLAMVSTSTACGAGDSKRSLRGSPELTEQGAVAKDEAKEEDSDEGTPPPVLDPGSVSVLLPQGFIEVIVEDNGGNPISGAKLRIAPNPDFSTAVKTLTADSAGMVTTHVNAGTWWVTASNDVDGDAIFFEPGVDGLGWSGDIRVTADLYQRVTIVMENPATQLIQGAVTDFDATWGTSVTGVATFDLGFRTTQRYFASVTGGGYGWYTLNELAVNVIGVVAFKDLDGDGRFDINVEPAITVNNSVIAPATNVTTTFPSMRTVTGSTVNGAGWTIYAQDRINLDPEQSRFLVGTQVIGASGTFSITLLSSDYRLRAFRDLNGNGVADNGEPDLRITPTFSTAGGNVWKPDLIIPSDVRIEKSVFAGGYLSPGESGSIEITLRNHGAAVTSLLASAAVGTPGGGKLSILSDSTLVTTLKYGGSTVYTIDVTEAAGAIAGEFEQIDVTIDGDIMQYGGGTRTLAAYVGVFNGAPYTVSATQYTYTDISLDGAAVELNNAELEQNSEWVDFAAGGGFFSTHDFDFAFYGQWITGPGNIFGGLSGGLEVGDNGYLSFRGAADVLPIAFPSGDRDAQMTAAPLWGNFIPGRVFALVAGAWPERVLTIQWDGLTRTLALASSASFQVKLYETSSAMEFIYITAAKQPAETVGLNFGEGQTWVTWQPGNATAFRVVPAGL